jgi:hypothetical protein
MTDRKYNLHNWTFVQYVSNSYRRTEIEVFKLDEHLSPCKLCAMPRPRSGRGAQSTDEGVYLAWTRDRFHCARKVFFRTFPSKYFFLMRRKAKHFFPIMWNRNIFFHKNNTLTTQIQQRNIFFSSRWQQNLFLSYNAKNVFGQLGHWNIFFQK